MIIKDIIAEGALSENSYMFRDIITSLDCLKCGSSKNLNIYITHAKQKDVICNKCNTEMKINSDRKISNFENKTFAELSIPNLELLTSDEKYIIINNVITILNKTSNLFAAFLNFIWLI